MAWHWEPAISEAHNVACKQTLFYFSFHPFQKHRRARGNERGVRERKIPTTTLLRWRSINPLRFIFYHPRSTHFQEKIEGLWTGYPQCLSKSGIYGSHIFIYRILKFNELIIFIDLKNVRPRFNRGGAPLYEPYRYAPPQRVGFLRCFGLKKGRGLAHFGPESGMVFQGTTGMYERIYPFNSKWVRKKEKWAN